MLASILTGRLYTVEAAAIGAIAITIYTMCRRELTWERLGETVREVMRLSAVVFTLMMGAMTFTLVFRIMGGDATVTRLLAQVRGGLHGATLLVLGLSLGLCLLLDALEILLVVVPLTMPTLLGLGGDPVWLAVMFAITIQSGFMMPPSGFAICFLRSVAPAEVKTQEIYLGVAPLLAIQVVGTDAALDLSVHRDVAAEDGLRSVKPSALMGAARCRPQVLARIPLPRIQGLPYFIPVGVTPRQRPLPIRGHAAGAGEGAR